MPAHRALSALLILVAALIMVSCAGTTPTADSRESGMAHHREADGEPTAEDLAERARELPGIDDVTVTYLDPDGAERDALPDDAEERSGWATRMDLVIPFGSGSRSAMDQVDTLISAHAVPPEGLEIWISSPAHAEVSARAYPVPDDSDPVRDAYLMAWTPGVTRSVFDGRTGDVRVHDASQLAKVADVAEVHGVKVDTVRTVDGTASLDIDAVPPRPTHITVEPPWPGDPGAPDCTETDLHVAIAGLDAFTGHRAMAIAAANVGEAPCALEGHPELTFRTLDEQHLDVVVAAGSPFGVRDPGVARLVIPVGARAVAMAGWNAMSTAHASSTVPPAVTAEVLLAVDSDWTPTELPLTSFVLTPEDAQSADPWSRQPQTMLDIVDGGEVMVTAWAPEGTEF